MTACTSCSTYSTTPRPFFLHAMCSFSFVYVLFITASVNGAAFNPLYSKMSSNLSRGPAVATRWDEPHYQNITSQDRPYSKYSHALSSAPENRLPRRKLVKKTTKRPTPSADRLDTRPTPEPTGDPSPSTTVHIADENNFSLLTPNKPGGMRFSHPSHCKNVYPR